MSPIQAMERSYGRLRDLLRTGAFVPGARLEANRLADELGVSMTPIRDALHQLVGERLVEANSGEGFRVPRISEGDLRALYEWNAAIAAMAVRTTPAMLLVAATTATPDAGDLAERTARLFEQIAAIVPNAELSSAIRAASDRLHPFRIIEGSLLEPIPDELDRLVRAAPSQLSEIRRYHQRRMRAAGELVRLRGDTSRPPFAPTPP